LCRTIRLDPDRTGGGMIPVTSVWRLNHRSPRIILHLITAHARPDDLGGELALAVAELRLERPFCWGKLAGDVLP
jgi:hypothetical protein